MTTGVEDVRVPAAQFDAASVVNVTWEAVRDLLYPYEGHDPFGEDKRIARVRPSRDQVKEYLATANFEVGN